MEFKSLGRIFNPEQFLPEDYTHASYPVAFQIPKTSIVRVLFSARRADQKSFVFRVDFEVRNQSFIPLNFSEKPVLCPGVPGLFDCDGISVGSIVFADGELRLYYLGWQLHNSVPWMNTIGMAKSDDYGMTFTKSSRVPVLDRSEEDPFSMSYPWVENIGGKFLMWYGSNLKWGMDKSEMDHVIKFAESENGKDWWRNGVPIFRRDDIKYDMSRPTVYRQDDTWYMLISVKNASGKYVLKAMKSHRGANWVGTDMQLDVNGDWDNEEQCYPSFFSFEGKVYVLYNGNGYGRSGFGLLELN